MFTEPTHNIKLNRDSAFYELLGKVRIARGWGDCCGHILVATGRADIAIDPQMSAWDIAALIPIIREAGGICTDWQGNEDINGGDGVSLTPALQNEVMAILKSAPRLRA